MRGRLEERADLMRSRIASDLRLWPADRRALFAAIDAWLAERQRVLASLRIVEGGRPAVTQPADGEREETSPSKDITEGAP